MLFEHPAELGNPFRVELLQVVESDAVPDAVAQTENIGEAVREGVGDAHLRVGDTHASAIGGHHELVFAFRAALEENLPAKVQGFFTVGFTEGIQISPGQGFDAMNVAVHPGVEPLVHRGAVDDFGIENDLVENGVVGVQPQLFLRPCQDRGSRGFCTGSGKRRDAHVVNRGVLDQVPALVVR